MQKGISKPENLSRKNRHYMSPGMFVRDLDQRQITLTNDSLTIGATEAAMHNVISSQGTATQVPVLCIFFDTAVLDMRSHSTNYPLHVVFDVW